MSFDTLSLGISPCPNDTFIFHALAHGLVPFPAPVELHFADVEELNRRARGARLDVTKVSLGAFPEIMHNYALLSSGAALGFGCGPLVVGRADLPEAAWGSASVAVPGLLTTANLLLSLHGGFNGERREMLFSDIMRAVRRGDVDLGVIIHEGRFTYQRHGLVRILDLGEWWEGEYRLPLPLGAIAIRREIPVATARNVQRAIADSVAYAFANPQASATFVREHAQELDAKVTDEHIKTFVTDFSHNLGEAGREAISRLVTLAARMSGRNLPARGIFLD